MLSPLFQALIGHLNAAKARFLLVGGYAVSAHGVPRGTKDIDLWVEATPDNARRVYSGLAAFGWPMDQLSVADLVSPEVVVWAGAPPHRVDVLTSISGVEFEDAWPRRVELELDGLRLYVIGREDLIANKRASGRPQDRADVARLIRQTAKRKDSGKLPQGQSARNRRGKR